MRQQLFDIVATLASSVQEEQQRILLPFFDLQRRQNQLGKLFFLILAAGEFDFSNPEVAGGHATAVNSREQRQHKSNSNQTPSHVSPQVVSV